MKTLLAYSVLLLLPFGVFAQNSCELTLTKAQGEFDAGRFHGVPAMLSECLSSNQNREFEQRAYLLLSETYLLLDDAVKAEESYLKVLQANPEFVTDETRDPIDLVYLSKKFTATPIFALSGRFGLNTTFVRVINDVAMAPDVRESYSQKIGWQGALALDYNYSSSLAASIGVNYINTAYTHTSRNMFDGNNLAYIDRQTWMNFPLIVKFSATKRALRPFCFAGYSFNLLLRDRVNMVLDGDNESEPFDYKYKRNTINSSLILGAGLKYKWGLRYLFGEVRYSMGLFNVAAPPDRYDVYNGINMEWPFADDDFRIDNVMVSVGYMHPIYKARKVKKPRTKSILRKTRVSDVKG